MENGTKTIIERTWRIERHITEAEFAADMNHAERMQLPVHSWTGVDRDMQPFAVTWVAGPETGSLFSAYEINGDAVDLSRSV